MNEFFAHPAVQSAVVPAVIALFSVSILRRAGGYWGGLGFPFAYFVSVFITMGFQLTPLTSTRKIILLGALACVLGLFLDNYRGPRLPLRVLIGLLSVLAVTWVIWPVVQRQEGIQLYLMLIPAVVYCSWLTVSLEALRNHAIPATAAALALGVGTGVSALLGASALLGQLASAIGAISGACLLLALFGKKPLTLGSTFMLPAAFLSALIGPSAVVYSKLPWYCLLPLVLIPLAARLVPQKATNFETAFRLCLYTLPLAVISIIMTWYVAGAPPV